ncbi:MAG TPA: helix-turn-helix domain-containing protein [Acidobacteriota bacterium]|nr:helix-turn-helix domain-containing protein [Acidobacteriota bacterium]
MKFAAALTEAERQTLHEAHHNGPSRRLRQRALAVYLSAKGYTIVQLTDIVEMDRDTISGWIDAWEKRGIVGLCDAPRSGRPSILDEADRQWLCDTLQNDEARGLAQAQEQLAESRGKRACRRTLNRALKKKVALEAHAPFAEGQAR